MVYSFKCSCGHVVTADAQSREEAVDKIMELMTPEAVAAHMAEKHPGEQVPTPEEERAMVAQTVVEGDLSGGQPVASA